MVLKNKDFQIQDRLKKIRYQIIDRYEGTLSDGEVLEAIQSIYDAAIDSGTVITQDNLPSTIMGAAIVWGDDGKSFTLTKGEEEIFGDSLIDTVVEATTSAYLFQVNDELLELSTGFNLDIRQEAPQLQM